MRISTLFYVVCQIAHQIISFKTDRDRSRGHEARQEALQASKWQIFWLTRRRRYQRGLSSTSSWLSDAVGQSRGALNLNPGHVRVSARGQDVMEATLASC